MTIQSTYLPAQHTIGGVGPYEFNWQLLSEDHIVVAIDAVIIDPGEYTVSLAGNAPVYSGGSITFNSAPSGTDLVIYRDTTRSQGTNYQAYDAFPAETHEAALDKLTLITQELYQLALGAIPPSSELASPVNILSENTVLFPSPMVLRYWAGLTNQLLGTLTVPRDGAPDGSVAGFRIFDGSGDPFELLFAPTNDGRAIAITGGGDPLDAETNALATVQYVLDKTSAVPGPVASPLEVINEEPGTYTSNLLIRHWAGLTSQAIGQMIVPFEAGTDGSVAGFVVYDETGKAFELAFTPIPTEDRSVLLLSDDPTPADSNAAATVNYLDQVVPKWMRPIAMFQWNPATGGSFVGASQGVASVSEASAGNYLVTLNAAASDRNNIHVQVTAEDPVGLASVNAHYYRVDNISFNVVLKDEANAPAASVFQCLVFDVGAA